MQAKKLLLSEAIDKTELHAYKDFFLSHLRPSVSLVPTTPMVDIPDREHAGRTVSVQSLVSESTLPLGSSRLGGKPDLPADFDWPVHEFGPYRFLGQINMKEVRAACAAACAEASEEAIETAFDAWLPPPPPPARARTVASTEDDAAGTSSTVVAPKPNVDDGLLSFFFAEDSEDRFFWRELDFVKAFYVPLSDPTLARRTSVPKLGRTDVYTEAGCIPVRPEPCWALPHDGLSYPDHTWPLTEEEADSYEYEGCIAEETKSTAQWKAGFLFGYPHYHTLCYDPTPEPDALHEPERKRAKPESSTVPGEHATSTDSKSTTTAQAALSKRYVPLLNMPSYYEELGWCWMDGDRLMVFIDADDLAKGNFTTVLAEAG